MSFNHPDLMVQELTIYTLLNSNLSVIKFIKNQVFILTVDLVKHAIKTGWIMASVDGFEAAGGSGGGAPSHLEGEGAVVGPEVMGDTRERWRVYFMKNLENYSGKLFHVWYIC